MLQNLSGWHALVILAIVLLIFGSSKLPQLAKSVGQSVRILKTEVHDSDVPTRVATDVDGRTVVASTTIDPLTGRLAS